jgi:hypothetical protein
MSKVDLAVVGVDRLPLCQVFGDNEMRNPLTRLAELPYCDRECYRRGKQARQ